MKVALLTDHFETGGGIEHIYHLVRGMPDIEFALFAKGGSLDRKFHDLPNLLVYNRGFFPKEVLKVEPEMIHIHHLKPLLTWFLLSPKTKKIPVIATIHGLHIRKYFFLRGIFSRLKFYARFFLEKRVLLCCNQVISVSREDATFIKNRYGFLNPLCIPNGVEKTYLAEEKSREVVKKEARKTLHLPFNEILYTTVARVEFQKGYDVLLKAVELIQEVCREKQVRFLCIGEGKDLAEMKKRVDHLGISDIITFAGLKKDPTLWMLSCDCFILPSRWEGLPLVLLEAGLLELPVIASDAFGNREVITSGESGLLFKSEDSNHLARVILTSLTTPFQMTGYGLALKKRVKANFSVKAMVAKTRECYYQ